MTSAQLSVEVVATDHEVKARLADFDAACTRGDAAAVSAAHDAAVMAFERHLDAKAALMHALLTQLRSGGA